MTTWEDVALPRAHAHGRVRPGRRARRHRDRSPHPLHSRRIEARRAAFRALARRAALAAATVGGWTFAAWCGYHAGIRHPAFQVDRVEVAGNGYLTGDQVRAAAGVAGPVSVWESGARMVARLEDHPLVAAARVRREPPSTIVIDMEETAPIGLVASPVVVPVSRDGEVLPLDPAALTLDLPLLRVAAAPDRTPCGVCVLARDAAVVADEAPEVFAVLSEARLYDREAVLLLGDAGVGIRYRPPMSRGRLRDAVTAINDAAGRMAGRGVREIDLRFADQVIVRTAAPPAGEKGAEE